MMIMSAFLLIFVLNIGTAVDGISGIDKAGEEVGKDYVYTDNIPPYSYIESNYGWHNHEIRTKIRAYDSLSGILAVSYMVDGSLPVVSYSPVVELNLSTEGVHNLEYSSLDYAGNAEQIKTSQVKLDFTSPDISVISPASQTYLHSDIIRLDFSGKDALSGIFSFKASMNGTSVRDSQEFDMLNLSPGIHEFRGMAADNAGNFGFFNVNFTVVSNIDSLIALNDRAIRYGWITSEDTAGTLSEKLTSARQKINTGQKGKANDMLKSYMNEIDAQTGITITPEAGSILTTEAAYVYISNV